MQPIDIHKRFISLDKERSVIIKKLDRVNLLISTLREKCSHKNTKPLENGPVPVFYCIDCGATFEAPMFL